MAPCLFILLLVITYVWFGINCPIIDIMYNTPEKQTNIIIYRMIAELGIRIMNPYIYTIAKKQCKSSPAIKFMLYRFKVITPKPHIFEII